MPAQRQTGHFRRTWARVLAHNRAGTPRDLRSVEAKCRECKRREIIDRFIQVTTTTDSESDAQRLADALVGSRQAACVQIIGPITSTYRWVNGIERATEWLCLIKTREDRYAAIESVIAELHTYDVPEILSVPVTRGSAAYLDWLAAALEPPPVP